MVCACTPKLSLTVENLSSFDRGQELAEVPVSELSSLTLGEGQTYVVKLGSEIVPSQVTYDGMLVFQSGLGAGEKAAFTVTAGQPQQFKAQAYGRFAPDRLDDFIWENDRVAFRIYGAALIANDGPSNGIDVLYKRSENMVLDKWYSDSSEKGLSYHEDNGTGLDDYKVGPTLGAGAMAPYVDGKLVLNENFRGWELLDNGPLRTTFRLIYNDLDVNGNAVSETRTISIDAGSQMSRIVQQYGFDSPETVAAGFPLHTERGLKATYVSGADWLLVDEPATGKAQGVLLGIVFPGGIDRVAEDEYTVPADRKGAGTYSHVLAMTTYKPGTPVTYYMGFGWEKWWKQPEENFAGYIKNFAAALGQPFVIIVK